MRKGILIDTRILVRIKNAEIRIRMEARMRNAKTRIRSIETRMRNEIV